ncbi:MAG: glycogen-binding domain-containing protein [Brevinematales bacterium]
MSKRIIEIIKNEEKLGEIRLTDSITDKIISKIEGIESYKKLVLLNLYKRIAIAASFVLLVIFGIVFFKGEGSHKVVITYPYNGEESVELVGSFNNWESKIPMQLDEERKVWKAEIVIKKKSIVEYQFVVDSIIYTTGDTIYKIKDKNGIEKAIISI